MLLCEENRGDIGLIRAALEECSTSVDLHAVAPGEAAIAFLQRRPPFGEAPAPSLLIADLYRAPPVVTQCFFDHLDQHRPPGLPIVLLTGSADPRHRADVARPWVAEYCLKPCDWSGYQSLIAGLVRRWVKRATP